MNRTDGGGAPAEVKRNPRSGRAVRTKADGSAIKPYTLPKERLRPGRVPNERLDIVEQMIARCWPHSRIRAQIVEKFAVGPAQAENYIHYTYERMRGDAKKWTSSRGDRCRAALEDVYDRCLTRKKVVDLKDDEGRRIEVVRADPDLHTAVVCLDRMAKIDGCYVEKIEISGQLSVPVTVTVQTARDELAQRLAARAPLLLPKGPDEG